MGDVHGVSKVEDNITVAAAGSSAPSAPQSAKSKFYTVKSGDTLSKVSKESTATPNRYNAIFEANKPMLEDPDKIYPGQVLRIP